MSGMFAGTGVTRSPGAAANLFTCRICMKTEEQKNTILSRAQRNLPKQELPAGLKVCLLVLGLAAAVVLSAGTALAEGEIKYADLGDFKLTSGEIIQSCKVGYRILGVPDTKKSNVVLVPTYMAGTSAELVERGIIGLGKMIDSQKYCIVAIDAFGNGVSSSPSNSPAQKDRAFPVFTVRDMVNAQYWVLTRVLDVRHVHAIAGISMGGMQVFEWLIAYPDFMDKAVSIVGTPWLSSYDMLVWNAELGIIDTVQGLNGGNEAAMKALAPLHVQEIWTPRYRAAATKPEEFADFLAATNQSYAKYNATDWAWQLKAILAHDIRSGFGGSGEKAARAVRAKCLIITSAQDHAIYPDTAARFAKLLKARAVALSGDCGHLVFLCEQDRLKSAVGAFLR